MPNTRWLVSLALASTAFVLGACIPRIGNSDGTCAAGTTCTCDGIGNCNQSCPGGNCHFVCTGIGNCITTCAGGGCTLDCSGTGNCSLDCAGGNCSDNCIGRTNCICMHCNESDAGPMDSGAGDAGTNDGGAIDACIMDAPSCCAPGDCWCHQQHVGIDLGCSLDAGAADAPSSSDAGSDAPG